VEDLEKVIAFIIEIEKLKDISRKTKPIGLDRFENSAEHSWHVCISALMLKETANETINIDRVIRMLLIHDLGEIDAGDTIVYAKENNALKAKEEKGLKRVLSILPDKTRDEFLELWKEFEAGETHDACFARAIDRIPPLLHNIYGGGHSWHQHKVSKEQVHSVNQRIELGSKQLWAMIRKKLDKAEQEGLFDQTDT
jgi:putative hydrolase of HD superfamily